MNRSTATDRPPVRTEAHDAAFERVTPISRFSDLEEKTFALNCKAAAARVTLEIILQAATDALDPLPNGSSAYREMRLENALWIIKDRASWMLRELKHPNTETRTITVEGSQS